MTSRIPLQTPIAIVGVAAQLPSGEFSHQDLDYETLWNFLIEKGQGSQRVGPELFTSKLDGAKLPLRGAFLKAHDGLDSSTFGISAKDARVMSFRARRLIELSFKSLLDSGINYRREKVGCFMSGLGSFEVEGTVNPEGSFADIPSALANRISYILDLTGPSMQLDTACSSSLTALHIAILAIEAGDCTSALVGAAQINRQLGEWNTYSNGGVLSPDGITKPFDAGADGFSRGEGAVVVVLKSMNDAIRDNDHIYCAILGSAVQSTGSRMPLYVPSGLTQKEVIRAAYARAGRDATDVDYVELHITGTSVGDPIEANAAGEIFSRAGHLDVGTVKGNLGHLEAAAFLASLVKACLILERKVIPPTINLSIPSTAIEWDKHRLRVPTEATPLGCRSPSGRSIISLSGSGIGGTTGHVVIESPPQENAASIPADNSAVTFVVGGLSPAAVVHICNSILEAKLSSLETMRACAVTLSRRARQLPWRTYFTLPAASDVNVPPATLVVTTPPPIIFIFSGQGPQSLEMGRGLFDAFPVFRSTILELDEVYRRVMGESLLETTGLFISQSVKSSLVLSPAGWPVTITVSAIAMIQIALFDLLASVGISPSSFAGHSAGETAILYASGAGSKAMALEIAIARGQSMTVTQSPELGMASLACSADAAERIMSRISAPSAPLEISCYNSPNSVALSGSAALLAEAVALARADGIFAQRIRTMVPGHSSYMDTIEADYMSRMSDIFARYPGSHVPRIPVFSTCTGEVLVDAFTPAYFWANCRNAVLFSTAISNALEFHADTSPLFLEISCHPVLSTSIYGHGVPEKSVLCPMRRCLSGETPSAEQSVFTETLARITLLGYNSCDLSGLYGSSDFKPSYIEHPLSHRPIPPPKAYPLREPRLNTGQGILSSVPVNAVTHPVLAQHVINGESILPATGILEMALEAGANLLWDVEFMSIFSLSTHNPARLSLERSGCNWSLTSVDPTASIQSAREHARGFMDVLPVKSTNFLNFQSLWYRLPALVMDDFYQSLRPFASFGPAFKKVVRCHGRPSELIAEIQAPSPEESPAQYLIHPATLDACIHSILHPDISKDTGAMYLPSKLGRFLVHNRGATFGNWYSHIRRRKWTPDSKSYDIVVADATGAIICEFTDLIVHRLPLPSPPIHRRFDLVFQPVSVISAVTNREPTYSQREPSREATLFAVLDSLAMRMISKSLQKNVTVGDNISRKRYFEFAKRVVVTNRAEILLSPQHESKLRTEYPAHFAVTDRISMVHETVFNSSKKAVNALYSDDLMNRFYSHHSRISTVFTEVMKTFSSLLDSLQDSGKRVINILEVGAGTGLLTRYLVDVLRHKPTLLVEYTVTDASYALAAELARTIQGPKMVPKLYDLTKDPAEQGLVTESYDVIVALHVLHAVPDIRACVSNLRNLLIPGGSLFVVEIDGTSWREKVGSIWYDCIFGSFSEWFGFADGRAHCTMSPVSWMEMLKDLDFTNSHASVEPGLGGHNFLFTAQKPLRDTCVLDVIDPDCVIPYKLGNEMEFQCRLKEFSPVAHVDLYIIAREGRDGDSAMGLCASLRREFPFWDIRLAIFASETHLLSPILHLSKHRFLFDNGEPVLLFLCDGSTCVSRVALAAAPTAIPADFPRTPEDPDYLTVEIIASGKTTVMVYGFIGRILISPLKAQSPGDLVVGVTDQPTAPIIAVPLGCIARLDTQLCPDPGRLLELAVPLFLLDRIPKRLNFRRTAVFIAIADTNMSDSIIKHFSAVETVALAHCDLEEAETLRSVDVVITDSPTCTQYPHLRHLVSRSGRFFVWDKMLRDQIRDGSEEVAHALDLCLRCSPETDRQLLSRAALNQQLNSALFRPDRTYVILGGIGGLGVDLAVWIYQHGARHIILTSRRGIASLDPETDDETLVKVAYLQERTDLRLRLEACDATDAHATSLLIKSVDIDIPIAGCFQMTLVLSDALFVNQTEAKFTSVRDSKCKAFELFANEVDLSSLDFYVAFSSLSGLVGTAGQSNYASACTALEGVLARCRNTFSVILPEIQDVGYLHRAGSRHVDKTSKGIFAISMSPAHLWRCVRDGLQKLKDGSPPFARYIPDLDWSELHAQYPLPRVFHHILHALEQSAEVVAPKHQEFTEVDVFQMVLSFVEMDKDVFDSKRPLLSYGLDSLSATRLSAALEPFFPVSQVQLLAGVSWEELQRRMTHPAKVPAGSMTRTFTEEDVLQVMLSFVEVDREIFDFKRPLLSYGLDSLSATRLSASLEPFLQVSQIQLLAGVSWEELRRRVVPNSFTDDTTEEPNIVELRAGGGIPLFVFPGIDGGLGPILSLRNHFPGRLLGVQVTRSTPTSPFSTQAAFFVQKIREKHPKGPYRLAGYSASGVLVVAIAKLLEDSGERVLQVAFIDHFPLLWTHEAMLVHLHEDLQTAVNSAVKQMAHMSRVDSTHGSDNEVGMEQHENIATLRRVVHALLQFLADFHPPDDTTLSPDPADSFVDWVSSVKAPYSVVTAEFGIITTLPEVSRGMWEDLGAHRCAKPVQHLHVLGVGHYGICADDRTAVFLQQY